jgi:hypothetical protein
MSAYALPLRPPLLTVWLRPFVERSPTDALRHPAASVARLSPVIFSAQTHLTSELLRFL